MRYLLTVAVVLLSACSSPALTFEEMASSYCEDLALGETVAECVGILASAHADLVAIGCEPESYDEMRCLYEHGYPASAGQCNAETTAVLACERRGCEAEFDARSTCFSGGEPDEACVARVEAAIRECLDARAE